jgi:hypothetical protein
MKLLIQHDDHVLFSEAFVVAFELVIHAIDLVIE